MDAQLPAGRAASGVLADRMAAALGHRESCRASPAGYLIPVEGIAYVPGTAAGPVAAAPGTFDDVLHAPPVGRSATDAGYARAAVIGPAAATAARGSR